MVRGRAMCASRDGGSVSACLVREWCGLRVCVARSSLLWRVVSSIVSSVWRCASSHFVCMVHADFLGDIIFFVVYLLTETNI